MGESNGRWRSFHRFVCTDSSWHQLPISSDKNVLFLVQGGKLSYKKMYVLLLGRQGRSETCIWCFSGTFNSKRSICQSGIFWGEPFTSESPDPRGEGTEVIMHQVPGVTLISWHFPFCCWHRAEQTPLSKVPKDIIAATKVKPFLMGTVRPWRHVNGASIAFTMLLHKSETMNLYHPNKISYEYSNLMILL